MNVLTDLASNPVLPAIWTRAESHVSKKAAKNPQVSSLAPDAAFLLSSQQLALQERAWNDN